MSLKKKLKSLRLAALIASLAILAGAQSSPQQPDEATAIMRYLNQTVSWYRGVLQQQQMASDPADIVFADNSRSIALQVLRLSFEFGHASANLLLADAKTAPAEQATPQDSVPRSRNMAQLAATAQALTFLSGIKFLSKLDNHELLVICRISSSKWFSPLNPGK